LAIDQRLRQTVIMVLVPIFLLGIANFAMHRAVLASGHPLLRSSAWFVAALGGRASLLTEFVVLLAAMFLADKGYPGVAWAYAAYSGLNAVAAWMILTRRV
jgi:hypothetical protein